jgi:nitrogen fixation/metabolism regulation signal transduction histidine kinase
MITSIASALGLKEIFVKIGLGVLTLLAIGLIIWRVVVWYDNQLDAAFNRGSEAAYAKVDKRATQLANQLTAAAVKLKDQANEEHLAIAVAATDLRVRGPGRASCPAPVVASTSEHQSTASDGAFAGPEVPAGNWARVPWDWLVTVVQEHDDLLNEDTAWRHNYVAQSEIISDERK